MYERSLIAGKPKSERESGGRGGERMEGRQRKRARYKRRAMQVVQKYDKSHFALRGGMGGTRGEFGWRVHFESRNPLLVFREKNVILDSPKEQQESILHSKQHNSGFQFRIHTINVGNRSSSIPIVLSNWG